MHILPSFVIPWRQTTIPSVGKPTICYPIFCLLFNTSSCFADGRAQLNLCWAGGYPVSQLAPGEAAATPLRTPDLAPIQAAARHQQCLAITMGRRSCEPSPLNPVLWRRAREAEAMEQPLVSRKLELAQTGPYHFAEITKRSCAKKIIKENGSTSSLNHQNPPQIQSRNKRPNNQINDVKRNTKFSSSNFEATLMSAKVSPQKSIFAWHEDDQLWFDLAFCHLWKFTRTIRLIKGGGLSLLLIELISLPGTRFDVAAFVVTLALRRFLCHRRAG